MILVAKALALVLKRPDTYYDGRGARPRRDGDDKGDDRGNDKGARHGGHQGAPHG
jgi:hypothetical protein